MEGRIISFIRPESQKGRISFLRAFNITEKKEQTFGHTVSAIKLNLFLSLDIPNLSVCQLSAKKTKL